MQLLWLKSDYIYPPDTGGKIRTYNLLRQLNRLCDVTYVSLKSDRSHNTEPAMLECADRITTVYRREEVKQGAGFYSRVLRHLPSRIPYVVNKYRCREITAFQETWPACPIDPRNPAVVVCDFLDMTLNVDWRSPYPKILFQHNVETMIWRRYAEHERNPMKRAYFQFEAERMARYESRTCNRFDLVLTVSEEDRMTLRDQFNVRRPMEVIETGVDVEYFAPRPDLSVVPRRLVFLGSLDWMPNLDGIRWFVQEVYPRIQKEHPEVTLELVGRRPGAEIRRMVERDRSILLTPDVADVRPCIARAELFIVPLRIGGGSRIKIYEAMAMQRPVVSTRIGAEGLALDPEQHLAITDESPEAFARAICHYLHHAPARETLARQGYQFVVENYPWSRIAQKFHQLCLDLAARPSLARRR